MFLSNEYSVQPLYCKHDLLWVLRWVLLPFLHLTLPAKQKCNNCIFWNLSLFKKRGRPILFHYSSVRVILSFLHWTLPGKQKCRQRYNSRINGNFVSVEKIEETCSFQIDIPNSRYTISVSFYESFIEPQFHFFIWHCLEWCWLRFFFYKVW